MRRTTAATPGMPGHSAGDLIEVEIEKAVYRGVGLARHQGKVVLVPRALPGDRWRVRLSSVRPDYARAEAVQRLADGPSRRRAPCPHAERCGGCSYQELEPTAQPKLKAQILGEALERGRVRWPGGIETRSGPDRGWRTRASLHVAWAGHGPVLGFHEQGTHRVVDVESCGQLTPGLNRALTALRRALSHRRELRGLVSGVDLAEGGSGEGRVATVVVEDDRGADVGVLGSLAEGTPELTGFGASFRGGRGRFELLRGSPFTWSEVAGSRFRVHAKSFFQANRHLVRELVDEVVSGLPEGEVALDLYAGVGLFALAVAPQFGRVLAAEVNPFAVADAVANQAAAGRRDALHFDRADVRQALASWPAAEGERVILDPPRAGAGREVVEAIVKRRPACVTYVACDPATLARDAAIFQERGFDVVRVVALDLFPETFHVEAVAQLRPR
jgi:23S rRNA (uracil1939-C5)-methyltransferase